MKHRAGLKTNMLLILTLTSVMSLSTGCKSFGWQSPLAKDITCDRPNADEKQSWRYVIRDAWDHPVYGPGVQWVEGILEKDCFTDEAEEIRDAS
jgi:hypothetical protein